MGDVEVIGPAVPPSLQRSVQCLSDPDGLAVHNESELRAEFVHRLVAVANVIDEEVAQSSHVDWVAGDILQAPQLNLVMFTRGMM